MAHATRAVDIDAFPSLGHAALAVLNEPSIERKADLSLAIYAAFKEGRLRIDPSPEDGPVPAPPPVPARPESIASSDPRKAAGSKSIKATIHSLVHAESYAIDLSWDILVRYGYSPASWSLAAAYHHRAVGRRSRDGLHVPLAEDDPALTAAAGVLLSEAAATTQAAALPRLTPGGHRLPDAFFADWARIASDEARHYRKWLVRLRELGGDYGDFPTHDGLWESAEDTADSLIARLAIVHCVHEGRGLDTATSLAERLARAGDTVSGRILDENHADEITHVAAGREWLDFLADAAGVSGVQVFHATVPLYFRGKLRPPFNVVSREKAGMSPAWYEPLAGPKGGAAAPGAEEATA